MTVLITRRQRAIKEHTCHWCKETIKPGDSYTVEVLLPGESQVQTSFEDYETISWSFGHVKVCDDCKRRDLEEEW